MNAKVSVKAALAATALVGLLACLLVLSGGLGQLRLHPGDPVSRSAEVPLEVGAGVSSLNGAWPGIQNLLHIVSVFVLACSVVFIVLIVVSPTLRRMLMPTLVSMLTAAGFLLIAARMMERFSVQPGETLVSQQVEATAEGIPDATAVSPPTWSFAVAAGVLATIAFAVGALLFVRFRRYWHRRGRRNSGLKELVDQVALSADRIRSGVDLRGEVIRCYQEMVNILSPRKGEKPTYLTPREFADSLRDAGMADLHIDRLTSIFELVRYGRREDARFAKEALTCLDAIRDAYGAVTSSA